MTVFLSSVHLAESVQIIIGCLRRTMQCNNVMLVMINHPTLFHSIAGRASAVLLQWVSKLLLLLTAQLTTQIVASQTAVQTENWLQRKLQEMIYANFASRGRNIAILRECINRSSELVFIFLWYSMETKPRAIMHGRMQSRQLSLSVHCIIAFVEVRVLGINLFA